jgi:dihydropyrimidinase
MHAENGIAIDQLVAQHVARGETDPVYHGISRPSALEGEATHRAVQLAKVAGCPLYIVHLSAAEALDAVTQARDKGQNAFAETCPQYLYKTIEDLRRPNFEGANFVCSPPLRPEEHLPELWRGLRTNDLAIVSTDHCPFCFKDQKEMGRGDFSKIPNGMAGVEHRMDLLYQGAHDKKISLARWVETCSTTPARMFGMYPKKGTIAPGSDADIVIYNPSVKQTLGMATQHMNVDYSSWEGTQIDGKVELVLSRGAVIIENDEHVGPKGHGAFVPRSLSQYLM